MINRIILRSQHSECSNKDDESLSNKSHEKNGDEPIETIIRRRIVQVQRTSSHAPVMHDNPENVERQPMPETHFYLTRTEPRIFFSLNSKVHDKMPELLDTVQIVNYVFLNFLSLHGQYASFLFF